MSLYLPLNPPVLKKTLNEGTWNMIDQEIREIENSNSNCIILVAYDLVIIFHTMEEMLNVDKNEYLYNLFFLRIKNGRRVRGHIRKFGNISYLKKEFDFSLV